MEQREKIKKVEKAEEDDLASLTKELQKRGGNRKATAKLQMILLKSRGKLGLKVPPSNSIEFKLKHVVA